MTTAEAWEGAFVSSRSTGTPRMGDRVSTALMEAEGQSGAGTSRVVETEPGKWERRSVPWLKQQRCAQSEDTAGVLLPPGRLRPAACSPRDSRRGPFDADALRSLSTRRLTATIIFPSFRCRVRSADARSQKEAEEEAKVGGRHGGQRAPRAEKVQE